MRYGNNKARCIEISVNEIYKLDNFRIEKYIKF